MRANLTPDINLATRLLDDVRQATFDGVGVTREAYGPGEAKAHAIFGQAATERGLEVAADHAGNLHMTLAGADRMAKKIILGSHLDSVPQGGNFDGAAGVAAGLATVAGLRRAGFVPARDITVLAIRAEEGGAWFPASFPGSNAALGTLPPDALTVRRIDSGRSLAEHMAEAGFDPDAVRAGKRSLSHETVSAYLELHIEQGPVLDSEDISVGIVTGIPGSRRLRSARIVGAYNHSGATPRRYRRDAAAALAEFAYRVDEEWAALDARGRKMVCTFCVMGTTEAAGFTKVAGEARFQLDVRSVDPGNVDALYAAIERMIPQIEARRGVRFELGPSSGSLATPLDPRIQDELEACAAALGVSHMRMESGGGHDAVAFAQAGIPSAMLFVRNQNGSHNPHEAMRMEDFAAACAVVTRWTAETAG